MSMTIWAQFLLPDGEIISDETDKHQLIEYMEDLDSLCASLGVMLFTEMIDYSEALEEIEDELDEEMLEKIQNKENIWTTPREAINSFDAVYETLSTRPDDFHAPIGHIQELLEELEDCLHHAQQALNEDSEYFRLQFLL